MKKWYDPIWVKVITVLIVTIMIAVGSGDLFREKKCPNLFFETHGDLLGCDIVSIPSDISGDGLRVVGSSSADEPSQQYDCIGMIHQIEATGWTSKCQYGPVFRLNSSPAKGLVSLGYLPSVSQSSIANGISPDGQITVGYSDDGPDHNLPVVFLWYPAIYVRVLPTGPVGMGEANDVSQNANIGQPVINSWNNPFMKNRIVVGYVGKHHPRRIEGRGSHAVFWSSWTNMVLLNDFDLLPNGEKVISSEAVCISNDGETIGGNLYYYMQAERQIFRSYPCIWKWNGQDYIRHVLEDLNGGDINARITHISGNGKVVVGWGTTIKGDSMCDGYPKTACKWNFTGATTATNNWSSPSALKKLPESFEYSYASGANFNGAIIVGSTFTYSGCHSDIKFESTATVWDGLNSVNKLETFLSTVLPSGYTLSQASRVSDNGKIITGLSYPPGTDGEAWTARRN
jgi:uncharacterized membrane protein